MSREQLEVLLQDETEKLDTLLEKINFCELDMHNLSSQVDQCIMEIVKIKEELDEYTKEIQLAENPEE